MMCVPVYSKHLIIWTLQLPDHRDSSVWLCCTSISIVWISIKNFSISATHLNSKKHKIHCSFKFNVSKFFFFYFYLFVFLGVDQVGRARYAINAKCILDADMAIAMEAPGNVYVIRIGVAFYAIKVNKELLWQKFAFQINTWYVYKTFLKDGF